MSSRRMPTVALSISFGKMRGLVRCFGLACAFALLAALAAPVAGAGRTVVSGRAVTRAAMNGERFARDGVIVRGVVDLSETDTVSRVFECHECIFQGRVSANEVTFERTVDLSGSTFKGGVDFSGATFRAPALFRAVRRADERASSGPADCGGIPAPRGQTRSCFQRSADFSLAVFDDFASFAESGFLGATSFDGAAFRGSVLFGHAFFEQAASFPEADFRAHTDFSQTFFDGGANFSGAQFAVGASFLAAQFSEQPQAEAARFQGVTTSGDLNFTFAVFVGAGEVTANFADAVCGAALVLRNIDPPSGFRLLTSQLQVRDLRMDVELARAIDDEGDEQTALKTIEDSAKARGDLREANDAHYALQVLKSRHYSGIVRVLDYVFYRGLAGYFVRPARPLLSLLTLVLVVSLARTFLHRRQPAGASAPPRSRVGRFGRHCQTLTTCLLDTFSLLRPRRGADPEQPQLARRLEALLYRLLLVCALLGLANSNPTLRQMVDSLL